MAKAPSVKATLKDATAVRTVWESNPDFKMGSVVLDDFIAIHDATATSDKEYAKRRVELTGMKGKRDDKARQLSEFITRFRSLMRATYGADSTEYGQAGGTRIRDRKTPKPRATAASA